MVLVNAVASTSAIAALSITKPFRVEVCRARIEVHEPDEDARSIHGERFRHADSTPYD